MGIGEQQGVAILVAHHKAAAEAARGFDHSDTGLGLAEQGFRCIALVRARGRRRRRNRRRHG